MDTGTLSIIVSVVNTIGLILIASINNRRSRAQKESEIIKNYGELITEYRTKIVELSDEIERVEKERQADADAHQIEIGNQMAIMQKRKIEYDQELSHLKNELRAYQIGWVELRRIAIKYIPKDIKLPEINEKPSQDIK